MSTPHETRAPARATSPAPRPGPSDAQRPGSPPRSPAPAIPRARGGWGRGAAPLRGNGSQVLQVVLFVAGAVLLPLGLIVIGLGWYGVAHTPYTYDQLSYLVSGGILGLGLTICGGFLYFGSWLARIAADQKEASQRLSDTLLVLADTVSHSTAAQRPTPSRRDPGSVPVVAGGGTTVHRADCDLVAGRDDLTPAGPNTPDLVPCRLCHPPHPGPSPTHPH